MALADSVLNDLQEIKKQLFGRCDSASKPLETAKREISTSPLSYHGFKDRLSSFTVSTVHFIYCCPSSCDYMWLLCWCILMLFSWSDGYISDYVHQFIVFTLFPPSDNELAPHAYSSLTTCMCCQGLEVSKKRRREMCRMLKDSKHHSSDVVSGLL